MTNKASGIVMEEITDVREVAEARSRRIRFDRNEAWLQAHVSEIYQHNRGRYICVSGEELFVADTAEAAYATAQSAHPEDNGRFVRYIPKQKLARVYAD